MRVLALTNLFPNARQPNRGIFNLQQFEALKQRCGLRVIAPLAWQPWSHGLSRPAPYEEEWRGIPTFHPFYFYTPGVGRSAYAAWMVASIRGAVMKLARSFRPHVLLATWAYPDIVAAAVLARELSLPWVARLHGSDINVLIAAPLVRRQVRWALRRAACTFAVSQLMKERLVELGAPAERVQVLHNGVDTERFALRDPAAARQALGLPPDRRILLYVGNLETIKGVLDLVEAVRLLRDASEPSETGASSLVVLVGGGRLQDALAQQVDRCGLQERVRLVGPRPHAEIPRWMAAANALCLPSHNEGCPNVVLEALACGRPVIASCVGAVPDLIDPECGALVPPGDAPRLAEAVRGVLARDWHAPAIRERVLPLSWTANATTVEAALRAAAQRGKSATETRRR